MSPFSPKIIEMGAVFLEERIVLFSVEARDRITNARSLISIFSDLDCNIDEKECKEHFLDMCYKRIIIVRLKTIFVQNISIDLVKLGK